VICFPSASQAAPVTAAWQDSHRSRNSCQTETVLRNVAVPVLAPVPAFELGVVCEAFGLDRSPAGLPAYDFAVCGEQVTPVPTTSGFAVLPGHDLSRLADADLIIVLGAAPPTPPPSAALVRQLRDAVARGATVASACTGAFVLAAAGLLDGRRVTTHWLYAPLLASLYPQLEVEADRLYIEDGPVVTSAGSAAVIDLCLHLTRREHGAEITNRVARYMVVPPHRDGGQSQYIEMPVPEPGTGDELAQVMQWALLHLDQPLTVDALAARASMSARTFARRFRQRTGATPGSWVNRQRVLLAARLLERGNGTIASVSVRSGFGSPDTLRRHFIQARGVTPSQYRRAFRLTGPGTCPPAPQSFRNSG
jgi:AraC family transcriptional regulator, transcriptional activator FtrA